MKDFKEIVKALATGKELNYELMLTDSSGATSLNRHDIRATQDLHTMIAVALINKALTGDLEAIRLYIEITKNA